MDSSNQQRFMDLRTPKYLSFLVIAPEVVHSVKPLSSPAIPFFGPLIS